MSARVAKSAVVVTAPSAALDNKVDRDSARARQLSLKVADRCKGKQKKGCSCCRAWKSNDPRSARSISTGLARELKSSDVSTDEDAPYDARDYPHVTLPLDYTPPMAPVEVHLADIAKPAKPRGGVASEFEFIPRLKPVVALPDWEAGPSSDDSVDGDDEWEHIESLAERKAKRKAERTKSKATYANVLSKAPVKK